MGENKMGKQVKKHGYTCKLVRVVDGDTCDAMIDLGFNVWVKERIRFYGVDTWESRPRDLEEKKKGLAAKARLQEILNSEPTLRLKSLGVGKFGRVLGIIYVGNNEKSVQDQLIEEGHGVEYFGGKR